MFTRSLRSLLPTLLSYAAFNAAVGQGVTEAPLNVGLDSAMSTDLRDQIVSFVREGFLSAEDIAEYAVDIWIEDGDTTAWKAQAERYTAEALAHHQAEQATWGAVTDCDKLDAAFAELERTGIVSRQNFTCCGTCGSAEIGDEIETFGRGARGYAFYHEQDTERAALGGGLYLNYGSVKEGEKAALDVAKEIVAALQKQGLATTWDGTWGQRIHVALEWRKRR